MKINTTMHKRTLERSLFCLLFVLSAHVIGLACSCKGLPDGRPVASEVEKSDFVIIGRTASIDISTAKITVERIYKGNLVVGEQIDFYQNRPDDCRMYFEKVGRKYLLYFTRPKGSTYSASTCGRSKRINRASEDLAYLNKFGAFPSI